MAHFRAAQGSVVRESSTDEFSFHLAQVRAKPKSEGGLLLSYVLSRDEWKKLELFLPGIFKYAVSQGTFCRQSERRQAETERKLENLIQREKKIA